MKGVFAKAAYEAVEFLLKDHPLGAQLRNALNESFKSSSNISLQPASKLALPVKAVNTALSTIMNKLVDPVNSLNTQEVILDRLAVDLAKHKNNIAEYNDFVDKMKKKARCSGESFSSPEFPNTHYSLITLVVVDGATGVAARKKFRSISEALRETKQSYGVISKALEDSSNEEWELDPE